MDKREQMEKKEQVDKLVFTLGNTQEDAPRRVEKPSRRRRVIALAALAALVLAGVLLAVLWDANAFDGLRRRFIYAGAQKDANGCARLYDYSSDRAARFAELEGRLLVASPSQLRLVGEKGAVIYEESVRLQGCAVDRCGDLAAVCDVGGSEVYLFNRGGLVRHMTVDGQLMSATLNPKGYLTLTVNESGYKGTVRVYDPAGKPAFAFRSADRFVMTAAVSRDGRSLLAATLGEAEGAFANRLVTYRLNSTDPVGSVELPGGVIYEVGAVGKGFCAVGEEALHFLTATGELRGTWSYEGDSLRRCHLGGDGYAAVLLGRYKSGSQCRLVTLREDGRRLASREVDGEAVSISAAGRYVAVLFSDRLVIYDKNLKELATLTEVNTVRQVLMRDDGSALLAGLTSASLYLP